MLQCAIAVTLQYITSSQNHILMFLSVYFDLVSLGYKLSILKCFSRKYLLTCSVHVLMDHFQLLSTLRFRLKDGLGMREL